MNSKAAAKGPPPPAANRDIGEKKLMWEYPHTFTMWSRGFDDLCSPHPHAAFDISISTPTTNAGVH